MKISDDIKFLINLVLKKHGKCFFENVGKPCSNMALRVNVFAQAIPDSGSCVSNHYSTGRLIVSWRLPAALDRLGICALRSGCCVAVSFSFSLSTQKHLIPHGSRFSWNLRGF